ncbi:MAG: outer membrane protein assembly factor BamA [Candidatus Rokuibacteriota bacterium]|nr:MAG: outer membrane protein assembly factor BamA [Candidatus Rokubacteria bacterium]
MVSTAGRVCLAVVIVLTAGLFIASTARAQQSQPAPIIIRDIHVEGNRRVQDAVILGRVKSTVGSTFNPSLLSEDIRSIFGLGFFDDVQLRVEDFEGGVRIVFTVSERPFVRDVDFVGNKKEDRDTLQDKIDIKLGSVYNPVDVQRAVEKLRDFYEDEGYFEVQITPTVEKFADSDVKLIFNIVEGRQITIESIVFKGNKGLRDDQLKDAMETKERQYFILRGKVQRQRLEQDIDRIIATYNDNGYIQARVESYDVAVDREKARVTITIVVVEGPQFRVGDVKITGVTLLPEAEVERQIRLKTGDVFSVTRIRDSVTGVLNLYSAIGRASADVNPKRDQLPAINQINLTFEITEGPEVYVERINISGNVRSEDKILRRELPLHEGDLYTLQNKEKARQRLVNLGYFETVNVDTQPGSDKTRIIVNIVVVERATGIFSIGGGYSSVDSLVGTIDLAQRNFLGRGWEVAIRIRAGATTQQGTISFTDPWLFDRPLSGGFDIYKSIRNYQDYTYDTTGLNLRLSHPFAEYWRWHTGYRISQDIVNNLSDTAPPDLVEQKGTTITSAIGASLTRDSRDLIAAPSKGGQTTISLDFAGLGGDSQFYKATFLQTYFKPIWFGHVLGTRFEAGYGEGWGGKDLPIWERFYLGGPNTIRAFKFRSVSPVDDAGFKTGGTSEIIANVEYVIPLPFGLRVAMFFDVGNVYGFGTPFDPTDLRYGPGAGIRWQSPFGPIRMDYGLNIDRRAGEGPGAFHFSVGSPF